MRQVNDHTMLQHKYFFMMRNVGVPAVLTEATPKDRGVEIMDSVDMDINNDKILLVNGSIVDRGSKEYIDIKRAITNEDIVGIDIFGQKILLADGCIEDKEFSDLPYGFVRPFRAGDIDSMLQIEYYDLFDIALGYKNDYDDIEEEELLDITIMRSEAKELTAYFEYAVIELSKEYNFNIISDEYMMHPDDIADLDGTENFYYENDRIKYGLDDILGYDKDNGVVLLVDGAIVKCDKKPELNFKTKTIKVVK